MSEEKNEEIKKLVAHLAHVINRTLSDSSVVRDAVDAINQNGYGIDLSLAACIGVSKAEETPGNEKTYQEEIKFEFDKKDIEFLKSLKLCLPDE